MGELDTSNEITLKSIFLLAEKQLGLQGEMENLAEKVKVITAAYKQIAENELPNLMAQNGMTSIKLESGASITIKEDLYVTENVPPGKMDAIVAFLKEQQAEELLKHVVIVTFPDAKRKEAVEVMEVMRKNCGTDVGVEYKNTVNVSSLKALIREIQADETIDLAPLGLYELKRSIIK